MKIVLLSHPRELQKSSNTGSLIVDVLGPAAEIVVWERTNPSTLLLDYLTRGSTALLYPTDKSEYLGTADRVERYIIIDSTWQEARKIYNRSPYLYNVPTVKIKVNAPSNYNMRRNQRPDGLCTAECGISVLRANGFDQKADELQAAFMRFVE